MTTWTKWKEQGSQESFKVVQSGRSKMIKIDCRFGSIEDLGQVKSGWSIGLNWERSAKGMKVDGLKEWKWSV